MVPRLFALMLTALLAVTSGLAESKAFPYIALSDDLLSQTYPLRHITAVSLASPPVSLKQVGVSGARLTVADKTGVLTLYGRDRGSKPWSLEVAQVPLCGLVEGVEVFVADLDRNGIRDLVLTYLTCGLGISPPTHFIAVTFEEGGRPVPFESEGEFERNEAAVEHLLDLDRDHRAIFVHLNYDDGYWITELYKVENARWTRLRGEYRGAEFPMFTRFTHVPNRLPTRPGRNRHPFSPDLTNAEPVLSGTLAGWKKEEERERLQVMIRTANGSIVTCTPERWYGSAKLLVDTPDSRRVALVQPDDESPPTALLREVVNGHYQVRLFGQRDKDQCSPELIWAGL